MKCGATDEVIMKLLSTLIKCERPTLSEPRRRFFGTKDGYLIEGRRNVLPRINLSSPTADSDWLKLDA